MNDTFKDEGGKILYTNKEMLELLRVNNATVEKVIRCISYTGKTKFKYRL